MLFLWYRFTVYTTNNNRGNLSGMTIATPITCFLKILRSLLYFILTFALLVQPAVAQNNNLTLIRDAEIEHYLRQLATPIFHAAKLNPRALDLVIIKNQDLNAFVAGGQNIFFFTGLLQQTETPEQLQGVIAHETGHIAGGHLIRGTQAMRNASTQAIIGMVAALLAGIASGKGNVAIGALGGTQQITHRNLMSYSRTQESSADTAALHFLDQINQSADGMLQFMKTLEGQEYVPKEQQTAYARTHPLSQDRIKNIEQHIKTSEHKKHKLPPHLHTQHKRMKAKLLGFIHPETALLRYTDKDPRPHARYARAIALHQKSQAKRALTLIEGLLQEEPENPFFHELKGQILFENNRLKPAIDSYKKTIALFPDSALIRVAYAHALLENKNKKQLNEIIKQLTKAIQLEPQSPQSWRFLATAWHRKQKLTNDDIYHGLTQYARAEESLSMGKNEAANRYATQAAKILPKKSSYWLRAQDIKLITDKAAKD